MDYLNTKSCLSQKLSLNVFTQIFLLVNHLKHNEVGEIKFLMQETMQTIKSTKQN